MAETISFFVVYLLGLAWAIELCLEAWWRVYKKVKGVPSLVRQVRRLHGLANENVEEKEEE